ncbi:hypothetical protein GOEFS_060_00250 [Gordonia effusa NBRC 100432]|uniref:Serine/threonine protein kinase n=1 Tax=Gordonia effusa NBRC 100432 TaxID=1077974 RepID=H0R0N1_9ACTN|nr:hypothetical protein [Gordonia effusa]GAB18632.1 hypothetical protein GOEFS_060_00250 [Gordonia effusa NBRC 100432]
MTYPGGNYQPSGPHSQGLPPEPPRSPWRSPIVLTAIAAGVLLVVAGVLAALILIPESESSPPVSSITTSVVRPGGSSNTSPPASIPPPAPAPGSTSPTTHSEPTVADTDWQGFIDGPRCNASKDAAVAIGLTDRSRVVICQVGSTANLYYKGTADGNSVEIDFPVRSGNAFTATNDGYSYVISQESLTITKGGAVLNTETMIAYWSD